MTDQADNLRRLVQSASPRLGQPCDGPPLIAVAGGQPGVGATTIAMNLAAVLADRGERVLLLDAAERNPYLIDAAGLRETDVHCWLGDITAGKCRMEAAVMAGPSGMMLVPNRNSRHLPLSFAREAQQRLLAELHAFQDKVDVVIVDIGSGLTPWTRRFWFRSQLLLLVTTMKSEALLDTYATVKLSVTDGLGPDVRLVVNRASSESGAREALQRLTASARRFLNRHIPTLPSVPAHGAEFRSSRFHTPRVWEIPDTPFGHACLWLGRTVSDALTECGLHGATMRHAA